MYLNYFNEVMFMFDIKITESIHFRVNEGSEQYKCLEEIKKYLPESSENINQNIVNIYDNLSKLFKLERNSVSGRNDENLKKILQLIKYCVNKYEALAQNDNSIEDNIKKLGQLANQIFEKLGFFKEDNDFWFKYKLYFYLKENGVDEKYLGQDNGLKNIMHKEELEQFYNENKKKILNYIFKKRINIGGMFIVVPKTDMITAQESNADVQIFNNGVGANFEVFQIYAEFKEKEYI